MIEERQGGGPHSILLALVVAVVVIVPFLVGNEGEAITEAVSELFSPLGLLLLLLTIQFLSADSGSFISSIFSTGEPDSTHHVGGSPICVALFLLFNLFLLYYCILIFGGDDDSGN